MGIKFASKSLNYFTGPVNLDIRVRRAPLNVPRFTSQVTRLVFGTTYYLIWLLFYSHPKYRAALYKKFPSLSCQASPDDSNSVASVTTAVSEEKPAA